MARQKTSERLVEMLAEKGYTVTLLMPVLGYWRSSPFADVQRWQAHVTTADCKVEQTIGSWDTMTACVRRGFRVFDSRQEGSGVADLEAYAEEP